MICEKILGNLSEEKFAGLSVDYVDILWHEAFHRLHRKTSRQGADIGIRMDHEILKRGLRQDDVIYADSEKAVAVNIPACEAIRAVVDENYPRQTAKLCYEVGNTHTSMFWGENERTFYMPYYEALFHKINQIHGVTAEKILKKFDFSQALSSTVNNHHH